MIQYTCPQCSAKLESPVSLAGELDKCPQCGYECSVPNPKIPKRRAFLIFGGAAGALIGAVVVVVIALAVTSGKGPSPSTDISGAKTPPKAVAQLAAARQEPSREKLPPPKPVQAQPPSRPDPAPLSPEQLFEKASPAVVYIVVRDKDFKPLGLGSGFFVDANGLVVTNYHVIKGAAFATARLSSGSTLFVDGVTATDPNGDLALLKISGGGFPCLKIANGALPKVGAAVYAIGNPQGLENTFSSGMVSGHREIKEGVTAIQVTAPISPGSSGGPLLNASGEVVGVTTAYLTTGQNLNFAVPVSGVSALMRKQGAVQTLASAGGQRLDEAETDKLNQAWEAMRKKDWSAATKALTELRKTQPDNPAVWYALGYLHRLLGNDDMAIEHYKQAIALKPDYADAYVSMGCAYVRLKRYDDAIAACKQGIALDPNDFIAHSSLGGVYLILNRYDEAIAEYKQSIAQGWTPDYVSLGEAYRGSKRYVEAIAAYKKAKPFYPNDAAAYYFMGCAYLDMKRYPEALAAHEQYLRVEPTGIFADIVREDLPRLRRLAGQ